MSGSGHGGAASHCADRGHDDNPAAGIRASTCAGQEWRSSASEDDSGYSDQKGAPVEILLEDVIIEWVLAIEHLRLGSGRRGGPASVDPISSRPRHRIVAARAGQGLVVEPIGRAPRAPGTWSATRGSRTSTMRRTPPTVRLPAGVRKTGSVEPSEHASLASSSSPVPAAKDLAVPGVYRQPRLEHNY